MTAAMLRHLCHPERSEGSAVAFGEFREPRLLGAPGLDFETWESKDPNGSLLKGTGFSPYKTG
jgi:hypothetical protein